MNFKKTFVDVILPLPLKDLFTYLVPEDIIDQIEIGKRAVVYFGKNKIYTGIIVSIHHKQPQYNTKSIINIIDQNPILFPHQLKFWNWISSYYMSYHGDVMQAALPSAFKLSGETKLMIRPDYIIDYEQLNEKEFLIIEALDIQKSLSIKDVSQITSQKNVVSLVDNLIEKGMVYLQEDIKDVYKPKMEKLVRIKPEYQEKSKLNELFETLQKKAYKQLEILMTYAQMTNFIKENDHKSVHQSKLLKKSNATTAQLNALVKKGVFKISEKQVSRLQQYQSTKKVSDINLTVAQHEAYNDIKLHFKDKKTVLLHGVTGSGKTEIYIKLIKECIEDGKQVLYLLPEIALTSQIIDRLRKYFGDLVGVYHSRYNSLERVEIWKEVLNFKEKNKSKYQIILGARSAVFLPFKNLGLVIVDEEHDQSFKQYEPAPRYNGRDVAIYLATQYNSNCILGTATPSFESYYNTQKGKYRLVEINERYGNIKLPKIKIANLKDEKKNKTMHLMFSSILYKDIQETLKKNKQVILFQNRRGFSLRVECDVCNWIPECKNCDVSMVYHKKINLLKCHYCGYVEEIPVRCPSCGSPNIFMQGYGTEQVENELQILFADKKVKRMDSDTTKGKQGHQRIINDFENEKIDILVGTQMVTKGLDFDNVGLVGILNADFMLNFPDFRAHEKAYQTMAQVSGRAGRKDEQGLVVIQTHQPNHPVIQDVISNQYKELYDREMIQRRNYNYPPIFKIIKLEVKHRELQKVNKAAEELSILMRKHFKKQVLGPDFPIIARIRNLYIKHLFIKIPIDNYLKKEKSICFQIVEHFKSTSPLKSVRIIIDVDTM